MTKSVKRVSGFQRASDGSMTLFEHLRELRGRLFKASLGVAGGAIIGYIVASHVITYLELPYCNFQATQGIGTKACEFAASGPLDPFLLKLKISLYLGLLIGSPIWLYQLWAFIAPGLHQRERRYTYAFTAAAVPLFAGGMFLAHEVVSRSLRFFLGAGSNTLVISNITGYFSFVTKMMLLFGAGFEFPLLVIMLNLVGMVTGRRLLGWWRQAVFLMFVFGAVVTPTPDPFSMSILAACMAILYFGAVGFALLNDKRKGRNRVYADLDDDAISPLDTDELGEPITAGTPIAAPEPIEPAQSIDRRYDDFT